MVAKAQRVDQRVGVFQLAVQPYHGGLAIGFDLLGTADGGSQALDHQRAEVGAVGLDFRLEVFDEAAAQRRELRRQRDQAEQAGPGTEAGACLQVAGSALGPLLLWFHGAVSPWYGQRAPGRSRT